MAERLGSKGAAGFTLLEMLVALTIVSVLAVGAVLALGRAGDAEDRDMQALRTLWQDTWALAVTGQQGRGFDLTAEGLELWWQTAGGWQSQGLVHRWQGGGARFVGPLLPVSERPRLRIAVDGAATPFVIEGVGRAWRCEGDGWRALTCTPAG